MYEAAQHYNEKPARLATANPLDANLVLPPSEAQRDVPMRDACNAATEAHLAMSSAWKSIRSLRSRDLHHQSQTDLIALATPIFRDCVWQIAGTPAISDSGVRAKAALLLTLLGEEIGGSCSMVSPARTLSASIAADVLRVSVAGAA